MVTAPRLFVLVGSPVDHSLSPALHAAAFRALSVDAVYGPLETEAGEVEPVMRAVSRSGGGNVTLPHKERAAEALDAPSEAVRATGACNCFWRDGDGAMRGDNTDVDGFLAAVAGLMPGAGEPESGPRLRGRRVLLLGAGGAARAVLHALALRGAGRVDVLNRTPGRAERMVAEVGGPAAEVRVLDRPDACADRYDLVVNATSLGLRAGDRLPLRLDDLEVGAAFDLVYGTGGTRWTEHARQLGIPARDGLEMLVRQAAASLRRWLGEVEPPMGAMREAARAAMGARDRGGSG